ncbi:MAG: hypothetical protein UY64_C0015G0007 [Parcubacteria group bacterium GW2011_GWA1_51_12]|nr:MAG: hypothetical protein UY64_C0015G0007 [Parcubacteria group bacterium GW2011_GWA1_51_12]
MSTTEQITVTYEQYRSLQQPVTLPSSEELFEFQRAVLADKGLARPEMFDQFATRLPSGLFLLVPSQPDPASSLNWNDLMARVELGGKTGKNYLDPKYLEDGIEAPKVPTMLVSVMDGYDRLKVKPADSRKNIAREGRHAYTTWRGYIHIVLFPEVLTHHGMDIVGSSCGLNFAPGFCLDDKLPTLNYYWGHDALPRWGAPSCGSVGA